MTSRNDHIPNGAWPQAMTQNQAASYCGLSVGAFAKACNVQPIPLTKSRTGQRYLRNRLDEWLVSHEDDGSSDMKQGIEAFFGGTGEA